MLGEWNSSHVGSLFSCCLPRLTTKKELDSFLDMVRLLVENQLHDEIAQLIARLDAFALITADAMPR